MKFSSGPRRGILLAFASLLVAPLFVVSPVSAASTSSVGVVRVPGVLGGDPLPYVHHNYFQRIGVVMVNDLSRPIFQVSSTPVYVDRYDYGVIRYDPVYETRVVTNYGWRQYTVRTGTTAVPVYATRTVRQVEAWRSVPVWASRSVCLDRWRSLCLRWGTEYYIERYSYEPVWGTRSEVYVSGYVYEPVYETRYEMYVTGTFTVREQVGTTPVMGRVKVCSLCMIESYRETKVLLGYEQRPVEQLVGPAAALLNCRAPGPNGDCGAKSRRFHDGSWWDYVGHSDSYEPRWDGVSARGGAGFPDCPAGQIRTLDGTMCITPVVPTTTVPPTTVPPTTVPPITVPTTTVPPTTVPPTAPTTAPSAPAAPSPVVTAAPTPVATTTPTTTPTTVPVATTVPPRRAVAPS